MTSAALPRLVEMLALRSEPPLQLGPEHSPLSVARGEGSADAQRHLLLHVRAPLRGRRAATPEHHVERVAVDAHGLQHLCRRMVRNELVDVGTSELRHAPTLGQGDVRRISLQGIDRSPLSSNPNASTTSSYLRASR